MTIQGAKKVLVTGSGGPLDSVIVPQLLAEGHGVRIFTDVPDKYKGVKGSSVEVVQGSYGSKKDLQKALDGITGVCLMGAPHEEKHAKEVDDGKAVIDACLGKSIGHVVYVSVCCSGKNTGVPHFESKHEVEEYLKKSGLSYTILRPVWYMENFTSKRYLPSIEKGVLSLPLRPDRTLELVSAVDVGRIIAEAFTVPDKLAEREIDIAADRLTMEEIAEEISRVVPKKVVYEQMSASAARKDMGAGTVSMFGWLDAHGFDADLLLVENLFKRFEISLTSFRGFLDRSRDELRKAA